MKYLIHETPPYKRIQLKKMSANMLVSTKTTSLKNAIGREINLLAAMISPTKNMFLFMNGSLNEKTGVRPSSNCDG
jgi:hypothetical protein